MFPDRSEAGDQCGEREVKAYTSPLMDLMSIRRHWARAARHWGVQLAYTYICIVGICWNGKKIRFHCNIHFV